MCLVIYWHGLRASEAIDLREGDIDLENGKVVIRRGKGSEGGLHDLQTWGENPLLDERLAITNWLTNRAQFGVKGGAKRRPKTPAKMKQSVEIVAFSPAVSPLGELDLPQAGELNLKPAAGSEPLPCPQNPSSEPLDRSTGHPGGDRLFPLTRSHVWKLVHAYMLEAGIPKYKCKTHTLKHTIAKHLVRALVPPNEIMEWMGWRSMETMMWYIRADEEELGQRIGDAIRGKMGLRQMRQGSLFP